MVTQDGVKCRHVRTHFQVADAFTKAMDTDLLIEVLSTGKVTLQGDAPKKVPAPVPQAVPTMIAQFRKARRQRKRERKQLKTWRCLFSCGGVWRFHCPASQFSSFPSFHFFSFLPSVDVWTVCFLSVSVIVQFIFLCLFTLCISLCVSLRVCCVGLLLHVSVLVSSLWLHALSCTLSCYSLRLFSLCARGFHSLFLLMRAVVHCTRIGLIHVLQS